MYSVGRIFPLGLCNNSPPQITNNFPSGNRRLERGAEKRNDKWETAPLSRLHRERCLSSRRYSHFLCRLLRSSVSTNMDVILIWWNWRRRYYCVKKAILWIGEGHNMDSYAPTLAMNWTVKFLTEVLNLTQLRCRQDHLEEMAENRNLITHFHSEILNFIRGLMNKCFIIEKQPPQVLKLSFISNLVIYHRKTPFL